MIGDESEGDDCDEVICAGWGEPGVSEQNEVDGMKKRADYREVFAVYTKMSKMTEKSNYIREAGVKGR